jgi:hypothetical protein
VLIRPHPSRLKEWNDVSLDDLGPVALWGRNPIDADSRADYFDSLSHAVAVVGLNTSAFLEAAIAGRPVLAILLEEFRDNQEGTLHFPYLLNVGGGLLHTSRSLEAHGRQLSETLADPVRHAERSARFVEAFLRPFGRAQAATPRMIAAIEDLAASPAVRRDDEEAAALSRWTLSGLERAYRLPVARTLFWDPLQVIEERNRAQSVRAHRRMKRRQHWEAQVQRARRHFEERREKAAARQAKERLKADRVRDKQRRTARVRRERLQAAIVNRLRRAFGNSPD